MIQDVFNKIIQALEREFRDVDIYKDNIEQGLTGPCFFIENLTSASKHFLGNKYLRNSDFCIHYFPADKINTNYELNTVLERLFDCMELIGEDGNFIRGNDMRAERNEGTLMFFVTYKFFVVKIGKSEPEMETVETVTKLKG